MLAALALSGCARYTVAALPDLVPGLVADCPDPPAKEGDNGKAVAKRAKAAARCERARKHAVVDFYEGLQANRK